MSRSVPWVAVWTACVLGGCGDLAAPSGPDAGRHDGGASGADAAPIEVDAATSDDGGLLACTAGATRACYAGDPALAGVGACRAGRQTCMGEEITTWGACAGAVGPRPEACGDGVDNDCDGVVDDGCPGLPPDASASPPDADTVPDGDPICHDIWASDTAACVPAPGAMGVMPVEHVTGTTCGGATVPIDARYCTVPTGTLAQVYFVANPGDWHGNYGFDIAHITPGFVVGQYGGTTTPSCAFRSGFDVGSCDSTGFSVGTGCNVGTYLAVMKVDGGCGDFAFDFNYAR